MTAPAPAWLALLVGDGSLPTAEYWRHHYVRKLRALHRSGRLRPGELQLVEIHHDAWCALLRTAPGYCDYDPEVRVGSAIEPGDVA